VNLNKRQKEAVQAGIDATLKIQAGAGTGKTRVLVARYLKFIFEDDIAPENLLALTFTKKAAAEMRERIFRTVMKRRDKALLRSLYRAWIMNFHQFAFRLIKENSPAFQLDPDIEVATAVDLSRIRRALYGKFRSGSIDHFPEEFGDEIPPPPRMGDCFEKLMDIIAKCRNALWSPKQLLGRIKPDDPDGYRSYIDAVVALWQAYENELNKRTLIDFDGMIKKAVEGLRSNAVLRESYGGRFEHILVDEFQDTSEAQNEMLRLLSRGDFERVTVVGDDKQSIYRWRDARVENLRDFPGKVTNLQTSYRSPQGILDLAHRFIIKDAHFERHAEEIRLKAHRGAGEFPICVFHPRGSVKSFAAEAGALVSWILSLVGAAGDAAALGADKALSKPVPYDDIAILMRSLKTSSGLPHYEEALRKAGIPYAIYGGVSAVEYQVLEKLKNVLTLLVYPDDLTALLGVLEREPFCLPDEVLRRLFDASRKKLVGTRGAVMDVTLILSDEVLETVEDETVIFRCRLLKEMLDDLNASRSSCDLPGFILEAMERTHYLFQLFSEGADTRLVQATSNEILHLVDSLIKKNESDLAAFIESLQTLIEANSLTDVEEVSFPEGRVKIMTIHQAKGLEFPAVAVPGIKNPPSQGEKFRLEEERGLLLSQGDVWLRGLKTARDIESRLNEKEQEERCLLYVAMTRAKDHLFLSSPYPGGTEKGGKKNLFSEIIKITGDADFEWEALTEPGEIPRASFSPSGTDDGGPDPEETLAEWEHTKSRWRAAGPHGRGVESGIQFAGWRALLAFNRCPLQYRYRFIEGMEDRLAMQGQADPDGEGGGVAGREVKLPRGVDPARYGLYVHRFLLEWMSEWSRRGAAYHELLEDLAGRFAFSSKVKQNVMSASARLADAYLESTRDDTAEMLHLEVPFQVRLDKVVFHGVIDRVDRDAEGVRIVDYKVGSPDSDYKFQVKFYAWALDRTLGESTGRGFLCYLHEPTLWEEVDLIGDLFNGIENSASRLDQGVAAGDFPATPGTVCKDCACAAFCPHGRATD
jgi:DNA helicase-2/ATP-dependent DNA helicase PcrA